MTSQHRINRSARRTGHRDIEGARKVQWHGSWQGETAVELRKDPSIEEEHIAIHDARDPERVRIFVVTGPKLINIRHAIITWAATRHITIV